MDLETFKRELSSYKRDVRFWIKCIRLLRKNNQQEHIDDAITELRIILTLRKILLKCYNGTLPMDTYYEAIRTNLLKQVYFSRRI